jgi:low affinity Fe/Cu permease
MKNRSDTFRRFAHGTADLVGTPAAFMIACLTILLWILSGPWFRFSDTWQLVINTTTTVITFLMVFLIQSSQNRDAKAVHLKLDELIHGVRGARNELVNLEELPDDELLRLHDEFMRMHEKAARHLEHRKRKQR